MPCTRPSDGPVAQKWELLPPPPLLPAGRTRPTPDTRPSGGWRLRRRRGRRWKDGGLRQLGARGPSGANLGYPGRNGFAARSFAMRLHVRSPYGPGRMFAAGRTVITSHEDLATRPERLLRRGRGWRYRPCYTWHQPSGFPPSTRVSAIDRLRHDRTSRGDAMRGVVRCCRPRELPYATYRRAVAISRRTERNLQGLRSGRTSAGLCRSRQGNPRSRDPGLREGRWPPPPQACTRLGQTAEAGGGRYRARSRSGPPAAQRLQGVGTAGKADRRTGSATPKRAFGRVGGRHRVLP